MLPPRSGEPVPYHVDRERQRNHLCRYCGRAVQKPRRTFCSEECVHEWRIRSDPTYPRSLLLKRDHGVCSTCGLDTAALKQEARKELHKIQEQDGVVVLLPAQGEEREVPTSRSLFSYHISLARITLVGGVDDMCMLGEGWSVDDDDIDWPGDNK